MLNAQEFFPTKPLKVWSVLGLAPKCKQSWVWCWVRYISWWLNVQNDWYKGLCYKRAKVGTFVLDLIYYCICICSPPNSAVWYGHLNCIMFTCKGSLKNTRKSSFLRALYKWVMGTNFAELATKCQALSFFIYLWKFTISHLCTLYMLVKNRRTILEKEDKVDNPCSFPDLLDPRFAFSLFNYR